MSRIGKVPVTVPMGVEVSLSSDNKVEVKGPKGSLTRSFPEQVSIVQEGAVLVVSRADDSRTARSMHGLSRTLLANMIDGVTVGFARNLDIVGVGYRASTKSPKELELALGFSHPVVVEAPSGIEFTCPSPTRITVSGIDKELVGQVAANIRKIRKPEPYKGKGVRYENEKVLRKVGKAGK